MAANTWLVNMARFYVAELLKKPAIDSDAKVEPAQVINRISSEILSLKPKTEEAGEENNNCFKKLFLP